ncbi:hypothetical protein J2795_000524 [Chryseobacterium bernardetii]|jgi:hypothetical protein|uniref:Uncharacterized protein n=3 Tax=Chryseobacterium TaxID=59732 RepID=A0A543EMQ9_9FLAO|nr:MULTISPECIES: hypothetical protein [Chryseobacterium]MDR6369239.1 hypothetical protein [Chryseobacterium vietnamense]MDR6439839.1 hypothetical protein [Chryseobacterium bernardetii]MDR6459434.1 hypothetical protein [Chryseobacterium vietnamense]MDR6487536.1 hypothetical protein [Chryseobacterium vietnamense]TQM22842.1 hypothetical protein FB551_2563 [Chryseobacterium aquifrigidense]
MNTNKKISALVLLAVGIFSNAQIKTNNTINATIGGESVYLDASSFPSSNNLGKGLSVPRTNLTTFTFVTPVTNALKFPTAYDGMIVYNSVAGTTPATGSGIGGQTVGVGFYYFSNPTPTPAFSSASGQWLPLGGAGKENILTTETVTNRQVNNAQIYGIKGTFAANGTTTAVTIPAPGGITALYGITIYKAGTNTVYSRELYSYDTSTGAAVTGSPSMSVVYPSGTYDYVLEYLK